VTTSDVLPETFELGRSLGFALAPLHALLLLGRSLLRTIAALHDDLLSIGVLLLIVVEEGVLVVLSGRDRDGSGVLGVLGGELLEVEVVRSLGGEVVKDVLLGPVELESRGVFVVDMVL
jgi:hypothetical protein